MTRITARKYRQPDASVGHRLRGLSFIEVIAAAAAAFIVVFLLS